MKFKNLKGSLILLLAAIIWGFAFVAQDMANAKGVGPFTLNAVRSFIGSLSLIPVSAAISKNKKEMLIPREKSALKKLIVMGTVCGVLLCISVNLQQFGIASYPPRAAASARAGFLTAMYILFVPILEIFMRKKSTATVWAGVVVAVGGLYLLCFSDSLGGVYKGDIIMLFCAVCFSLHILCIDNYTASIDPVKLSCIQFFVCAVISSLFMFIFEEPSVKVILSAALPILFLGIMSSGVAYTLQIIGQKNCDNPALSSIAMSFESVFAAIGGAIYGDMMSKREIMGCVIMFIAIIIVQLPSPLKRRKK